MCRVLRTITCLALLGAGACNKSDGPEKASPAKAVDSAADDEGGEHVEPTSGLPDAEALLDKAVEAVGGRDKLDAIESFYYSGQITIMGQNIASEIEIWWKDGDFYTEQPMVGIGMIRAGKAGETIWSEDPIHDLRKLEGPEAEQHTWASSLMLAADWQRYFTDAETVEERELEGKKVYDVKLTSKSGSEVLLTFDADTGLQVAQAFEQVTPMGDMPVAVRMKDYREVEGVKVAFQQITDASLAKATQTITKIEINPEIDTSKFAMPTSNTEVVDKKTMMPFDADGKPGKPLPEAGH